MAALPYGSLDYDSARETTWDDVKNKPTYLLDWTTDQGDTNLDANNFPILPYAPNTLASNGTAGLTNYNFSESRKNKLSSIAAGAQVNVQTDWNATAGTPASIANKPTWIPSSNPGYLTSVPTSITDAIALNSDKKGIEPAQESAIVANTTKLASIASGAQVNVQTDWNATAGTPASIANKPTWIPSSDPGYMTSIPSEYLTETEGDNRYITQTYGDNHYVELTDTGADKITHLNGVSSDVQSQITSRPTTSTVQGWLSNYALISDVLTAAGGLITGALQFGSNVAVNATIPASGAITCQSVSTGTGAVTCGALNVSDTFAGAAHQCTITSTGAVLCSVLNSNSSVAGSSVVSSGPITGTNINATGNLTKTYNGAERFKVDAYGNTTIIGDLTKMYGTQERFKVNAYGNVIAFGSVTTTALLCILGNTTRVSTDAYGRLRLSYSGVGSNSHTGGAEIFFDPIYGHGYFSGYVHAVGTHLSSDDRLKFNEKDITNGLEVVRRLQPQTYDKSNVLDQEVDTRHEVGLIAQHVLLVPELSHTVHQGKEETRQDDRYNLDYNGSFVYGLAAIKELDTIVTTQAATIAALDAKVTSLLARFAEL